MLKILLISIMFFNLVLASDNKNFSLSEKEKIWLNEQSKIKVGIQKSWPPLSYLKDGKPKGVGVDYLNLINKKLNNKLVFIADNFKNNLEKVESGELDAMIDITPTKDRQKTYLFTTPYIEIPHIILSLKKDKNEYYDESDLNGKVIAIEKGYISAKKIAKSAPNAKFKYYENTIEAIESLSRGEVDIYIGNRAVANYILHKNFITNLEFKGKSNLTKSILAIGINKEKNILRDILQKALNSISEEENNVIIDKYIGNYNDGIALTNEEKKWIKNHPILKVGGEMDWPPFDFVDKRGEYSGIAKDYLELISKKSGLKFEHITGMKWSELIEAFKTKEIDILPAIYYSKEREEFVNFTKPYMKIQNYIFMRENDKPIKELKKLEGKKVAIIKEYVYENEIRKNFPKIQIYSVDNLIDGLNSVLTNQADAYIDLYSVVTYTMNERFLTGLKPVMPTNLGGNDLHIGVRKDYKILSNIITKAIDSITNKEHLKIRQKWSISHQKKKELIDLTNKEKLWIKNNPIIKVASEKDYAPWDFFQDGKPAGFSIDYVKLLAKKSGLKIEFITDSWGNLVKMAESHKIDLLHAVFKNKFRKNITYVDKYKSVINGLYINSDIKDIHSIYDLKGKRVVIPKGDSSADALKRTVDGVEIIEVDGYIEVLKAVAFKKADATILDMAVANYLIKENTISNLKAISEANFEDEMIERNYYIAIRDDYPELASIMQKAMKAITKEELKELEAKWLIDSKIENKTEPKELSIYEILPLKEIIITFIIFSIVIFFIFKYQLSQKHKELGVKIPIVAGIIFFLIIVSLLTITALNKIENRQREEIRESLKTVLYTTHETLKVWLDTKAKIVKFFTKESEFLNEINNLYLNRDNLEYLKNSKNREKIDEMFLKNEELIDKNIYFIVSKDFKILNSSNRSDIGKEIISKKVKHFIEHAMEDKSTFMPPFIDENRYDNYYKNFYYLESIYNNQNKLIAILAIGIDPQKSFSQILQQGRIGNTGETYALNEFGRLISQSRFDKELIKRGILKENQNSFLNLLIKEPNRDFTQMAKSAMDKQNGININGYIDYRGVRVYGAWLWDNELHFAISSEIDENEAIGAFLNMKKTILIIVFSTIFFTLFLTILIILITNHSKEKLKKVNSELKSLSENLEKIVDERTVELKNQQQQFASMVDNIPGVIYRCLIDENWSILFISDEIEKISGYPASDFLINNSIKSFDSIIHHDDREWVNDYINRRIKYHKRYYLEYRIIDKNGKIKWISAQGQPIFEGDKPKWLDGVLFDITKQKTAEHRLKLAFDEIEYNQQFLNTILDSQPNIVLTTDGIKIKTVNRAFMEFFNLKELKEFTSKYDCICDKFENAKGYLQKEMEGLSWIEYILANQSAIHKALINENIFSVYATKIETENEKESELYLAVFTNITKLEKAEEERQKANIILKNVSNAIEDLMFYKDKKFIYIGCNEAFANYLGLKKEYIIGKSDYDIFEEYEADFLRAKDKELIKSGESQSEFEWVKYHDGRDVYLHTQKTPFKDENGNIYGVVGLSRDITIQKRNEEELAKAKEEAEKATKAKSEFLSNMSHEIRTPMNAVIGFTELMEKTELSNKQKSYLTSIKAGGKGLLTIINDILDLSKIEAGKMRVEYENINPYNLFNDVRAIFSTKIEEKNLDFLIDIEDDIPKSLILDETRVRQIVFNLVGNAIKFTEKGYIAIRVKKEFRDKERSKLNLIIDVTDTGIGIPPKEQDKIFQSFEQQDGQSTRKYGGTGLGLAISKKLAQIMDGDITLSSEVGVGSTFSLHLKDVAVGSFEELKDKNNQFDASKIEFKEAKILIVDDVETNRTLVKESIADTNLKTIEASDGKEAVEIAKRNDIDLILMDLSMPNMNGYEATKQIKSFKDIPIIALTASVMHEDKTKAKEVGFNGYLNKPVSQNELFKELIKYLKHEVNKEDKVIDEIEAIEEVSPKIIEALEGEIREIFNEANKTKQFSKIKKFAEALLNLIKDEKVRVIEKYATTLIEAVENFDIETINKELDSYEELLEKLK